MNNNYRIQSTLNEDSARISGTPLTISPSKSSGYLTISAHEEDADKKKHSLFSPDQLAKIKEVLPKAVTNSNLLYMKVAANELSDPNSTASHDIQKLVGVINSMNDPKFGKISASDILRVAKPFADNRISGEKESQIMKDDLADWINYIQNWGPEALESLQKMHIPLSTNENLTYILSDANIDYIRQQNKRRVEAGFPEATYILSPQEWESKYNREVNWEHQYPIYYKVPMDGGRRDDPEVVAAMRQMRAKQRASDPGADAGRYRDQNNKAEIDLLRQKKGNTSMYKWYAYYDISDTVVIPGRKDLWNSAERRGVVDNTGFEIKPTAFSQGEINGDDEANAENRKKVLAAMGNEDLSYILAVYKTLHIFLGLSDFTIPTDEDGNPNINVIKSQIFGMLLNYIDTFPQMKEYAKKEGDTPNHIKKWVAGMYVGRHRIDNERAISQCQGLNRDELIANAMATRTIYNHLSGELKKYIYDRYQGQLPDSAFQRKLDAHPYQGNVVKDKQGKAASPYNNIPSGYRAISESYLPHGTYESTSDNNMNRTMENGSPQFESYIDSVFDMLGMSDVDTERMDNGTSAINESADNWFNDDDNDGIAHENNDFENNVAQEGEFDNRLYTCCPPQTAEKVMSDGFHIADNNNALHGPGVYFCTTLEHAKELAPKYGGTIIVAEIRIPDMIDYKPWGESQMAIARSGDAVEPVDVIFPEDYDRTSLQESYRKSTNERFFNLLERINKLI